MGTEMQKTGRRTSEKVKVMKQCEFCGAILPDGSSFCGKCGRVPSQTAYQATHAGDLLTGDLPTAHLENAANEDAPTLLLSLDRQPSGSLRPVTLIPIEEEEEEERRRAALFGFGFPLAANQQPQGQIPSIQGTPQ